MNLTDAQCAAQDALNLIEKLRRTCTDLAAWGHLDRAQRYLVHPEGYETDMVGQKHSCWKLISNRMLKKTVRGCHPDPAAAGEGSLHLLSTDYGDASPATAGSA